MEIIEKYFPDLTSKQYQQIGALAGLYENWNQQINVVSRKDIDQLYLRHVLHSLGIAKYLQFAPGTRVMDVGTGGGFPGIPLAILFPEVQFTLVDSIGKKIKVVKEVTDEIGLHNCEAIHCRAEDVKGKFDFVVSRAVTALPTFVAWVRNAIQSKSINQIPNGILALKGGELSDEMQIPFKTNVVELATYFEEEFFTTKKLIHVQV